MGLLGKKIVSFYKKNNKSRASPAIYLLMLLFLSHRNVNGALCCMKIMIKKENKKERKTGRLVPVVSIDPDAKLLFYVWSHRTGFVSVYPVMEGDCPS